MALPPFQPNDPAPDNPSGGNGPPGAGLTDLLTTARNILVAINGLNQAYLNVNGAQTASAISSTTLVKSSAGRVCTVSITTAGVAGVIYDANTATNTARPIYAIPGSPSIGVISVNLPVSFGIVIAPGAGQVVSVSFS